jgi:ELWxxDGT repeat protein
MMTMNKLRGLCLLLLLLLTSTSGKAQPAFLVEDLNTTRPAGVLSLDRFPSYRGNGVATLGDTAFFRASDGIHGVELWQSDGTQAGTRRVADVCPGSCSSQPDSLMFVGEQLFFAAFDGVHGQGLWTSDGTQTGTRLVEALIPENRLYVIFEPLADLDGMLVFSLSSYDRQELWRSDGTTEGTFPLADVETNPFAQSWAVPFPMTDLGGKLFLLVNDVDHGWEIWTTDGTAAGTGLLKDIAPGPPTGAGGSSAVTGGRVLFAGHGPEGSELWASDGTPAGTALVKDLLPGPEGSNPHGFWAQSGIVFFYTYDGSGQKLWRSDGTAAGTYPLVPPSVSPPVPRDPGTTANGLRFYVGPGDGGSQMWVTDGTEAGTRMLRIIDQKSGLTINDQGEILGPRAFFDLDGTLLFQGDDGSTGAELWRSDGTEAGTFLVKDLHSSPWDLPAFPGEFTRAGDTVFFRAGAGSDLEELWKTDGTSEGTELLLVNEHLHEFGVFGPRDLTALGDLLLFATAWSEDSQEELWKSDGTWEGTTTVRPILPTVPGPPFYVADSIVSLGNVALFRAEAWWNDRYELWKSDGTEAGSASLGVPLPFRVELEDASAVRDGVLLFATSTPEHGEELWRSDGTEAGTFLLAETVAGPDSKPLGPFATAGPAVFFAAAGNELWKNDDGGTALVRALPGNPIAGIRSLTAVGSRVYFSYDDGAHGRELWVSDGTEAGTRMVEDLFPGPGSSHPRELRAQGSILVFTALDGVHGVEPWRSDGTALGTRMLQDIAPGDLPSSPTEFTASGSNLYFAANDGTTGFELWALPRTALLSTFADVPAGFWAWSFVEALAASGITNGCAPDHYCPGRAVTRAESAVLLLRALHGADHVPPPGTRTRFADVPATHWAVDWIEQFAADGISRGCSPTLFCEGSPLSRAEIAVFLLRAKHGASYVPPPATGTVFEDVPANHWVGAWIEQLAAEGITAGCAPNRYCPGQAVTRAEMAAFLVRTFGLATP